jgi:hypothetical protein
LFVIVIQIHKIISSSYPRSFSRHSTRALFALQNFTRKTVIWQNRNMLSLHFLGNKFSLKIRVENFRIKVSSCVMTVSSPNFLFLSAVMRLLVVYLMSSCVNLAVFGTRGPLKRSFDSRLKMAHLWKKGPITHTITQYNVFSFDEFLKSFKSLKIFKITLTFRFDKLWHLLKSVRTGENSQILTVSNKNIFFNC